MIGDQRVSITTDTWTSIQNINYMVVTAHFMDNDWKLHKRIINFTKINSHKGEDIGKTLELCLKGWGIDKVFSITVDNASANDGAVRYMSARLKEINTLLFDGLYLHMRCACHILNLIVKDGLDELQGSVDAIRYCAKFLHSSPSRLDKFREFAVLLKFGEMSNVPLDVVTRWNSTYKMLASAIKFKMVFKRMIAEYTPLMNYFLETKQDGRRIRAGPPTDDDWEQAAALVHFLEIFYDATLALSATKTCTSTLLFDQISFLQCEIKLRMDDHNAVLSDVAHSMMIKFDKYWGSFQCVNKLVYVAHALNPRMKLQMIEEVFKDLGKGERQAKDITDEIKGCILNLYHAYRGEATAIIHPSAPSEVIEEAGLSRLELRLKRKRMEEAAIEISNEVDKYLNDPFEKLEHKGFDLLQWWKCNQTWYPVLSRIAKDIFSIPASTVASENAFSLGGRIVDPFRASLTPKVVEALVCTSDWFRAEEFNFYKEPTDEEMEFYKELEELEICKCCPFCLKVAN